MECNDADAPLSGTPNVVKKQLSRTREEVERAREAAVQAWLASMPLNGELERLCAELAAAKTRLAATAAEIPPLKSLIESTYAEVAARQAEAAKKQAAAEKLRMRVECGSAELEQLRAEVAAARDAKDALERRVLVRRQSARALQLAERAVAAEAQALAWSARAASQLAARAWGEGDDSDAAHHDVVTLPARRLEELRRAVEAEELEAAARVEEAEARRRAAKARRAAAVARLDAARAKRREAQDGPIKGGDKGYDKRTRRVPSSSSRRVSGTTCFTIKKLPRFLRSSMART